ncbi:MAG: class I SAM-dependent rRNA methyltransferase, partial [Muribaculaceae bacterium]|nr:class I SAM-dependent rRNA methyltransferase [Muribaculaceae bacterium]
MDYPVLKLKRGKDESLRRFHPWVFSGALTHMPADLEEGSVVRVLDHDGNPMGVGHFQ